MTTPTLSFNVRNLGRHYASPPLDPDLLPLDGRGSLPSYDKMPKGHVALPSVTNILGVIHKNLIGYGGEHAIRAGYENGWPKDCEEAVKRYKWAANRHRDRRADAGTRAHTIAEALTLDAPLPSSLSEEDEAYADAFMAFWSDFSPVPLHVEATVYGGFYAGTADLIAEVDGVPTVFDWKTRAVRDDAKIEKWGLLYESNRMQLAALTMAESVAVEGDAGWVTVSNVADRGAGVVLFPDGTYAVEWVEGGVLGRWWAGFEGAARLWSALRLAA